LRLLAALFLRDRNPEAAEKLVPQLESEILVVPSFRQTLGTVVCKGDFDKLPNDLISALDGHENPGVNPYVLQELIPDTEHAEGDPHAALRENHTPAILLYPECNYLSWKGAIDYRRTLPNLKIYYIPRAGHYIQFEQPELLKQVILAFLLDHPDAVSPTPAMPIQGEIGHSISLLESQSIPSATVSTAISQGGQRTLSGDLTQNPRVETF